MHTCTSMHMCVYDEETMNIDEETINVGSLTARNCTSELTVRLLDRKKPIMLTFDRWTQATRDNQNRRALSQDSGQVVRSWHMWRVQPSKMSDEPDKMSHEPAICIRKSSVMQNHSNPRVFFFHVFNSGGYPPNASPSSHVEYYR